MRVKQTARKSTATSSAPQANISVSSANDPISRQIAILETKRKSATPRNTTERHAWRPHHPLASRGKDLNNIKIKPKAKSGEKALKEIRKLRGGWDLLIPRAPFHRIVREITQQLRSNDQSDIRYQTAALQAIQEAAEAFLTRLFEDSYLCTVHAKRVTLFASDIRLVLRLQGTFK